MDEDQIPPNDGLRSAFDKLYGDVSQSSYVNSIKEDPYKNGITYEDYEAQLGHAGEEGMYGRSGKLAENVQYGEYDRLGIMDTRDPYLLQENMAKKQGTWEQIGRAGKRFFGNLIYDTIGGIGSMLDIEDYMNSDDEVGNWLTTWAESKAKEIEDANPIYQRANASAFGPGAFTWWLQNGSDLAASAASFIAQGGLALKGLQAVNWLSKLATGASLAGDLGVALKTGKDIATGLQRAEKVGQTAQQIEMAKKLKDLKDNFATSLMLNQSEAVSGATQLYSKTYGDAIARGYGEDYAKQVAAATAENSININRANILLNMTGVDKLMKRADNLGQSIKPRSMWNTAKSMAAEGVQEAGEEAINLAAEKQSERLAKSILDQGIASPEANLSGLKAVDFGNPFYDATWSEIAETSLLGALGGAAQTGLITGVKDNLGSETNLLSKIPLLNKLNAAMGQTQVDKYTYTDYYSDGTLKYKKGDIKYELEPERHEEDNTYEAHTTLTDENISTDAINKGYKVGDKVKEGDTVFENKKGEEIKIRNVAKMKAATTNEEKAKVLEGAEVKMQIKRDDKGNPIAINRKNAKGEDQKFSLNQIRDERAGKNKELLDAFKEVIDRQAKMISSARYNRANESAISGIEELIKSGATMSAEEKQAIFDDLAFIELANEGDVDITIAKVKERAKKIQQDYNSNQIDEKSLRQRQDKMNENALARMAVDAFENNGKDTLIAMYEDVMKLDSEKAKEKGYGENYRKNAQDSIDKINKYYDEWTEFNAKHEQPIAKALFQNRRTYEGLSEELDTLSERADKLQRKELENYVKKNDADTSKIDADGKTLNDKLGEAFEIEREKNRALDNSKKLRKLKEAKEQADKDVEDFIMEDAKLERERRENAKPGEAPATDLIERQNKLKELQDKSIAAHKLVVDEEAAITNPFKERIKALKLNSNLSDNLRTVSDIHNKKLKVINRARELDAQFDKLRSEQGRYELNKKNKEEYIARRRNRIFLQLITEYRDNYNRGGGLYWYGGERNDEGKMASGNHQVPCKIEYDEDTNKYYVVVDDDITRSEDAKRRLIAPDEAEYYSEIVKPGKEEAWKKKKAELEEKKKKELELLNKKLADVEKELGLTDADVKAKQAELDKLNAEVEVITAEIQKLAAEGNVVAKEHDALLKERQAKVDNGEDVSAIDTKLAELRKQFDDNTGAIQEAQVREDKVLATHEEVYNEIERISKKLAIESSSEQAYKDNVKKRKEIEKEIAKVNQPIKPTSQFALYQIVDAIGKDEKGLKILKLNTKDKYTYVLEPTGKDANGNYIYGDKVVMLKNAAAIRDTELEAGTRLYFQDPGKDLANTTVPYYQMPNPKPLGKAALRAIKQTGTKVLEIDVRDKHKIRVEITFDNITKVAMATPEEHVLNELEKRMNHLVNSQQLRAATIFNNNSKSIQDRKAKLDEMREVARGIAKDFATFNEMILATSGQPNLIALMENNPDWLRNNGNLLAQYREFAQVLGYMQEFFGEMFTAEGQAMKDRMQEIQTVIVNTEKLIEEEEAKLEAITTEITEKIREREHTKTSGKKGALTKQIKALQEQRIKLEQGKNTLANTLSTSQEEMKVMVKTVDLFNDNAFTTDANGDRIANISFLADSEEELQGVLDTLNEDLVRIQGSIDVMVNQVNNLNTLIDSNDNLLAQVFYASNKKKELIALQSSLNVLYDKANEELYKENPDLATLKEKIDIATKAYNNQQAVNSQDWSALAELQMQINAAIEAYEIAVDKDKNDRTANYNKVMAEAKAIETSMNEIMSDEAYQPYTDKSADELEVFIAQINEAQRQLRESKQTDMDQLDLAYNSRNRVKEAIAEFVKVGNSTLSILSGVNERAKGQIAISETMLAKARKELAPRLEEIKKHQADLEMQQQQEVLEIFNLREENKVVKAMHERLNKLIVDTKTKLGEDNPFATSTNKARIAALIAHTAPTGNLLKQALKVADATFDDLETVRTHTTDKNAPKFKLRSALTESLVDTINAELKAAEAKLKESKAHWNAFKVLADATTEMFTSTGYERGEFLLPENAALLRHIGEQAIGLKPLHLGGSKLTNSPLFELFAIPEYLTKAKEDLGKLALLQRDPIAFKQAWEDSVFMLIDINSAEGVALRNQLIDWTNQVEAFNNDLVNAENEVDKLREKFDLAGKELANVVLTGTDKEIEAAQKLVNEARQNLLAAQKNVATLDIPSVKLIATLQNALSDYESYPLANNYYLSKDNKVTMLTERVNPFVDYTDTIKAILDAKDRKAALDASPFKDSIHYNEIVAKLPYTASLSSMLNTLFANKQLPVSMQSSVIDIANLYVADNKQTKPMTADERLAYNKARKKLTSNKAYLNKIYGEEYVDAMVALFGKGGDERIGALKDIRNKIWEEQAKPAKQSAAELADQLSIAYRMINRDEANNFQQAIQASEDKKLLMERELVEIADAHEKVSYPSNATPEEIEKELWQPGKEDYTASMSKFVKFKSGAGVVYDADGVPIKTANLDEVRFNNFLATMGEADEDGNLFNLRKLLDTTYQFEFVSITSQNARPEVKKLGEQPSYNDDGVNGTKAEWDAKADKKDGGGLIAVITNKEGNWVYSDNSGNIKVILPSDLNLAENKDFFPLVTNVTSGVSDDLMQENMIFSWLKKQDAIKGDKNKHPKSLAKGALESAVKYNNSDFDVEIKVTEDTVTGPVTSTKVFKLMRDRDLIIDAVRKEIVKRIKTYRISMLEAINNGEKVYKDITKISAGDVLRSQKKDGKTRAKNNASDWLDRKRTDKLPKFNKIVVYKAGNDKKFFNRVVKPGVPYIELKDGSMIDTWTENLDKNDVDTVLTLLYNLSPTTTDTGGNAWNKMLTTGNTSRQILSTGKDENEETEGLIERIMAWRTPEKDLDENGQQKKGIGSGGKEYLKFKWQPFQIKAGSGIIQYKGKEADTINFISFAAIRAWYDNNGDIEKVKTDDRLDATNRIKYAEALTEFVNFLSQNKKNINARLLGSYSNYYHPTLEVSADGKKRVVLKLYKAVKEDGKTVLSGYESYLKQNNILKTDVVPPIILLNKGFTGPNIGRYVTYEDTMYGKPNKPEPVDDVDTEEEIEEEAEDAPNTPDIEVDVTKLKMLDEGDSIVLEKEVFAFENLLNSNVKLSIKYEAKRIGDRVVVKTVLYETSELAGSLQSAKIWFTEFKNGVQTLITEQTELDNLIKTWSTKEELALKPEQIKYNPLANKRKPGVTDASELIDAYTTLLYLDAKNDDGSDAYDFDKDDKASLKTAIKAGINLFNSYLPKLMGSDKAKEIKLDTKSGYTFKYNKKEIANINDTNTLSKYLEPINSEVADYISKFDNKLVVFTPVFMANETIFAGSATKNAIAISPLAFASTTKNDLAALIAHEYTHSIIYDAVRNNYVSNKPEIDKLEQLRDAVLMHMLATDYDITDNMLYTMFGSGVKATDAKLRLTEAKAKIKAGKDKATILSELKKELGLKDGTHVEEFITMVMNHKDITEAFDKLSLLDVAKTAKEFGIEIEATKVSVFASFIKMLNTLVKSIIGRKPGKDSTLREIIVRGGNMIAEVTKKKETPVNTDSIFGVSEAITKPITKPEPPKASSDNKYKEWKNTKIDATNTYENALLDVLNEIGAEEGINFETSMLDDAIMDLVINFIPASMLKGSLSDIKNTINAQVSANDNMLFNSILDTIDGNNISYSPVFSPIAIANSEIIAKEIEVGNYNNVYAVLASNLTSNELNQLLKQVPNDEEFIRLMANGVGLTEYINRQFADYMIGETIPSYLTSVFDKLKEVITSYKDSNSIYTTTNSNQMAFSPVVINTEYKFGNYVLSEEEIQSVNDSITYRLFEKFTNKRSNPDYQLFYATDINALDFYKGIKEAMLRDINSFIEHYDGGGTEASRAATNEISYFAALKGRTKTANKDLYESMVKFKNLLSDSEAWNELVRKHAISFKQFGITLDNNTLANLTESAEEAMDKAKIDAEDDSVRDTFSKDASFMSDTKDSVPPAIKLLIGTLSLRKKVIVDGKVTYTYVRDNYGFPKLVDFDKTYAYLAKHLSNLPSNVDIMLNKLRELASTSSNEMSDAIEYLVTAATSPINSLSKNDEPNYNIGFNELRLVTQFIQSFAKQRPDFLMSRYDTDGDLHTFDSNRKKTSDEIKNRWKENAKSEQTPINEGNGRRVYPIVDTTKAGKYNIRHTVNELGDLLNKSYNTVSEKEREVAFGKIAAALKRLGFTFENFTNTVSSYDKMFAKPGEKYKLLSDLYAKGSVYFDLKEEIDKLLVADPTAQVIDYNVFFRKEVAGTVTRIAEAEANVTTEVTELQHMSPTNKTMYGITLNHGLSIQANDYNYYSSLANPEEELRKNTPHLFNVFNQGSRIRRKLAAGTHRLEVGILAGATGMNKENSIDTGEMGLGDRQAVMFATTLEGINTYYRAADRGTENLLNLRNRSNNKFEPLYSSELDALNAQHDYLLDELRTIYYFKSKEVGNNLLYYANAGQNLRFFSGDKLSASTQSTLKRLIQEAIDSGAGFDTIEEKVAGEKSELRKQINAELISYFEKEAKIYMNKLRKSGMLQPHLPSMFSKEVFDEKLKRFTVIDKTKEELHGVYYAGIPKSIFDPSLSAEADYLVGADKKKNETIAEYLDRVKPIYDAALLKQLYKFNLLQNGAYIEQAKVVVGDPAMYKNADDFFKRMAMWNSTKKISVLGDDLDAILNYRNRVTLSYEGKPLSFVLTNEETKSLIRNNYDLAKSLSKDRKNELINLSIYKVKISDVKITTDLGFNEGRILADRPYDGNLKAMIIDDKINVSHLAVDKVTSIIVRNNALVYLDEEGKTTKPSHLTKTFAEAFYKDGVNPNMIGIKTFDYVEAYRDMKISDAQAYVTLSAYKEVLQRAGDWSKEQEAAYNKVVKGEELQGDELALFRVLKTQYTGVMAPKETLYNETFDTIIEAGSENNNLFVPIGYKHSLMPLIPQVIKGTNLAKLADTMREKGVDLAQMQSANKFGTKTQTPIGNEGVKQLGKNANILYNSEGKFVYDKKTNKLNGRDLITQESSFKYFGIQVDQRPKLKGEVTATSQGRKLILSNTMINGVPYDYTEAQTELLKNTEKFSNVDVYDISNEIQKRWHELDEASKKASSHIYSLSRNYITTQRALFKKPLDKLKKEIDLQTKLDSNGNIVGYVIGKKDKLIDIVKQAAIGRDASENMLASIESLRSTGEDQSYLEQIIGRDKIENVLFAIINSRVIKEKRKGEGSPQVSVQGFEFVDKDGNVLDKQGNVIKNSNDNPYPTLRSYEQGFNGQTMPAQIMVGLPKNLIEWVNAQFGRLDGYNAYLDELHAKLDKIEVDGEELELDELEQLVKNMIEVVAFRIPNQGLNSNDYMRVRRYMPYVFADSCVVPAEMVAKAGSDFDIDKLNIYYPHYTKPVIKDGKVVKQPTYITYDESNSDKEVKARWTKYVMDNADRDLIATTKTEIKESDEDVVAMNEYTNSLKLTKAQLEAAAKENSMSITEAMNEKWSEKKKLEWLWNKGTSLFKDMTYKSIKKPFYDAVERGATVEEQIATFKAVSATERKKLIKLIKKGETTKDFPVTIKGEDFVEQVDLAKAVSELEDINTYYDEYLLLRFAGDKDLKARLAEIEAEIKVLKEEKSEYFTDANAKASLIREVANETKELINDAVVNALVKKDKLPTLEQFKQMNIEEQNSGEQLENRILELQKDILALNYNYRQLVAPVSDATLNSTSIGAVYAVRLARTNSLEWKRKVDTARQNILAKIISETPNLVAGTIVNNKFEAGSVNITGNEDNYSFSGNKGYGAGKEVVLTKEGNMMFAILFAPVYAKLQDEHGKEWQDANIKSKPLDSVASTNVNIDKFKYFLSGLAGVGQTAVHVTNHQLAMQVNLYYENREDYFVAERNMVKINDEEKTSFAGKLDAEGEWISETLSAFVNAYVDVAKDPFIFDLNGGNSVANTIFLLVRSGHSIKWITRFLTQPIIVDYVTAQEGNEGVAIKQYLDGGRKKKEIVASVIAKYKVDSENEVIHDNKLNSKTIAYVSSVVDGMNKGDDTGGMIFKANQDIDTALDKLFEEHELAETDEIKAEIEEQGQILIKSKKDRNKTTWSKYNDLLNLGLFSESKLGEYIEFGHNLFEKVNGYEESVGVVTEVDKAKKEKVLDLLTSNEPQDIKNAAKLLNNHPTLIYDNKVNEYLAWAIKETNSEDLYNVSVKLHSGNDSFWSNNKKLYGDVQTAILDLFLEYQRQSKYMQLLIRSASADTKAAKKNIAENIQAQREIAYVKFLNLFGNADKMISDTVVEIPNQAVKESIDMYSTLSYVRSDKFVNREINKFANFMADANNISKSANNEANNKLQETITNEFNTAILTADFGNDNYSPKTVFEQLFIPHANNTYVDREGNPCTLPKFLSEIKNMSKTALSRNEFLKGYVDLKTNMFFAEKLTHVFAPGYYTSYKDMKEKDSLPSEPMFDTLTLNNKRMKSDTENKMRRALLLIKDKGRTNPIYSKLYEDLVRFAFAQSGMNTSDISWTRYIPAEDTNQILKDKIKQFINLSQVDKSNVIRQFKDQFERRNSNYIPDVNSIKRLDKDSREEVAERTDKAVVRYTFSLNNDPSSPYYRPASQLPFLKRTTVDPITKKKLLKAVGKTAWKDKYQYANYYGKPNTLEENEPGFIGHGKFFQGYEINLGNVVVGGLNEELESNVVETNVIDNSETVLSPTTIPNESLLSSGASKLTKDKLEQAKNDKCNK